MTGKAMQKLLHEAGIEAQKVVRKRQSGYYTADFFVPDMQEGIASSAVWASQITQQFAGRVTIIAAHDMVASWRPGKPIICATVIFAILD